MSDLAELFNRDPLSLTREDRSVIIAKMRESRQQFILGAKAPKAEKAVKAPINLADLDI